MKYIRIYKWSQATPNTENTEREGGREGGVLRCQLLSKQQCSLTDHQAVQNCSISQDSPHPSALDFNLVPVLCRAGQVCSTGGPATAVNIWMGQKSNGLQKISTTLQSFREQTATTEKRTRIMCHSPFTRKWLQDKELNCKNKKDIASLHTFILLVLPGRNFLLCVRDIRHMTKRPRLHKELLEYNLGVYVYAHTCIVNPEAKAGWSCTVKTSKALNTCI